MQDTSGSSSYATAINSSNIGFQLLKKLGWKEGSGLGVSEQGRLEPVETYVKNNKRGLGADQVKKKAVKPDHTDASKANDQKDSEKKTKACSKRLRKMQEVEKKMEEKEFERVNYKLEPNVSIVDQKPQNLGGIWKDIGRIGESLPAEMGELVRTGITKHIGDGVNTRFWLETWIGIKPLKLVFPWLYDISLQQQAAIADMGVWNGLRWQWSLEWKRELLVCEVGTVDELLNLIDQVRMTRESRDDKFMWRFDPSNGFSVKSFLLQVQKLDHNAGMDQRVTKASKIWQGVAPPRAELCVWFVHVKRMYTRERLCRLGILQPIEAICPLCFCEVETNDHLFFTCVKVWRIWMDMCKWWGIQTCLHSDPMVVFNEWSKKVFKGAERNLWLSIYFAVIWNVWKARNRVIFENWKPNWEVESRLTKLTVAWWIKAGIEDCPFVEDEVVTDLHSCREWLRSVKRKCKKKKFRF